MNVPGHLREAVRRHAHLADATIALGLFAAVALATFVGRKATSAVSHPSVLATAAVACAVLAVRRRRPFTALVISAAAAEIFLGQVGSSGGVLVLLAPSLALYTIADQVERRSGLIVCALALAALVVVHAVERPTLLGPENLAFAALGAMAIAVGDSSRHRRAYLAELERRAARAEHERERDARRRVAEERLRIARDLHDSVGHHLALISVQSDVAGRAIEVDGAAARQALGHVKSASRKALEELRDTVSLLRQPGDPVAPTTIPAPGLDALAALLETLRSSGLEVDVRVAGGAVALAPAADLTAYRLIQESLTNVYKHSSTRCARLALAYDRHELRITVEDLGGAAAHTKDAAADPAHAKEDARHGDGASSPGRHGIVGMRERVLALGGRFEAGPRRDRVFQVAAALPYQPLVLAPERAP